MDNSRSSRRLDYLVNGDDNDATMLKDVPPEFIRPEDERPHVAHDDFSGDTVPLVYLDAPDATDSVRSACEKWGIFHLLAHGIEPALLDRVRNLSRAFFALPADRKLLYDMRAGTAAKNGGGGGGGFVVSSHLPGEPVNDFREMFIYFSYPLPDRDYSRWPADPPGWRAAVEEYSAAIMALASRVMGIFSEALGLPAGAVEEASGGQHGLSQKLVVNFYPRCPQPDRTLGLHSHTDPTTVTLLLPDDEVSGLQASNDGGATWATVRPVPGALVVIVGDHMHFLSNGRFRAADHRAVVNANRSRLSIAGFHNPAPDAVVYPLPGLVLPGEPCVLPDGAITFTEMYRRKMTGYLEQARQKKLLGTDGAATGGTAAVTASA